MKIPIPEPNGPICPELLNEFEREIGATLPDDYWNYLVAYNGEIPELTDFSINEEHGWSYLQAMGDLASKQGHTNLFYYREYADQLPDNLIAIGDDGCANLICLSISGDDLGQIYFWEHSRVGQVDLKSYDMIYPLAESFTEFLSSLAESPDDI